jgi:hypothetical protein
VAEETEKPTLLLSEEESTMTQRILRSSRRDISRIDIKTKAKLPVVVITMFGLRPAEVEYKSALKRDDDEWKEFFAKHPPLI